MTAGALFAFRAIETQHVDRKHDIIENSPPRQQRGTLENNTDVPARTDDGRAVEQGFPAGDVRKAAQDLQQRALTAPARPDHGQEFTVLDREIDGRQRKDVVAIPGLVDLGQLTADDRVGALRLATPRRGIGRLCGRGQGRHRRYVAGTMAMTSISTSMPGNAS